MKKQEVMAISGEINRVLISALAFLALLIWMKIADYRAMEPPAKMGRCGDNGVLCLGDLPYVPGERQVEISKIEVK